MVFYNSHHQLPLRHAVASLVVLSDSMYRIFMSIFPVMSQLCIRLVENDWLEMIGNVCFLLSVSLLWWVLRGKAVSVHPLDLKESTYPDAHSSTNLETSTATSQQQQSFPRLASSVVGADTPAQTGLSRAWGSSGGSPDTDYDGYDSAMSSDVYASPTQLFKVPTNPEVTVVIYRLTLTYLEDTFETPPY